MKTNSAKRLRTGLRRIMPAVAACAAALAFAPAAKADILSISAMGFNTFCPPCIGGNTNLAEEERGVIVTQTNGTKYFAPVVIPRSGSRVCAFSLIYQDKNDADTIVAQLKRKIFVEGGNPFNNPRVLATVQSAPGVVETTRIARTTTIASPIITNANSFYYVEINAQTFNMNVVGVQIDVRPTCP